jgi:hypothetical protein
MPHGFGCSTKNVDRQRQRGEPIAATTHSTGTMNRFTLPTVFLCLTTWASSAGAERPGEKKHDADYILTGKVEKVFKRQDGRYSGFVVQLWVREVHKAQGVKRGDMFYAYCFQMGKPPVPVTEASGHKSVPAEGEVIKAYVHHRRGKYEGNYPEWYEVVEGKKEN